MSTTQGDFTALRNIFMEFKFEAIEKETERLLGMGVTPKVFLNQCQMVMKEIGEKFERKEFFLPELIAAGEIFKSASERIRLFGANDTDPSAGQIVLGTPKGDIHDLGKDIFAILAQASGFLVHNLGVDVPAESFLDKIEETGARVLGMSSLMTTNIKSMEETINLLARRNLRTTMKVIIGGGATTRDLAVKIGADDQTWDAYEGVRIVQSYMCAATGEVAS